MAICLLKDLEYESENILVIFMKCDNISQNMDFQMIILRRNQAHLMRIGERAIYWANCTLSAL